LISGIPAGDGKLVNLFLRCTNFRPVRLQIYTVLYARRILFTVHYIRTGEVSFKEIYTGRSSNFLLSSYLAPLPPPPSSVRWDKQAGPATQRKKRKRDKRYGEPQLAVIVIEERGGGPE
jgi:hypothetical protein